MARHHFFKFYEIAEFYEKKKIITIKDISVDISVEMDPEKKLIKYFPRKKIDPK